MLISIQNVLDKDDISAFKASLKTADWQSGSSTAGTQAIKVKANEQLDEQSPLAKQLADKVINAVSRNPTFISAALPVKIYPPRFNCYRGGGRYGTHVDNALMPLPGGNEMLRADLSATLFISEPGEYEGGELKIESTYGTQAIKLAAGDMILYPSSSLHQVTPVTRGTRLASFFWLQSMVSDGDKRALLYDLDQSIQGLTLSASKDDENLSRLTGVYHNLIRQWAVV